MFRSEQIHFDEQIAESKKIHAPEVYMAKLRELGLDNFAEAYNTVCDIGQVMKEAGGRAMLVGGSVRDMVMGIVPKDYDLEIYNIPAAKIKELVSNFGRIDEAGKSFGVLKLSLHNGVGIDISLPRTDSKVEAGHGGFEVNTDPTMSIPEAAKRRDFTMNSLAADPITGELVDPYGGVEDIRNHRLKATDPERFKDDPLRVLRGIQFISRFGLEIERDTVGLMQDMAPLVRELSQERVLEEWKKMMLKSAKPSIGLAVAHALGILREIHPNLPALAETEQEPEWHPEGNVWIHTLMVIDEAAKIVRRENLDDKKAFTILMAAFCHDFGKPATTETNEKGRIISHAHEAAGAEPTLEFLESLGVDNLTKEKIVRIVVDHLTPSAHYATEVIRGDEISDGTIRRLAHRLHPATIEELVYVCEADHLGRGEFPPEIKEEMLLEPTIFAPGKWLLDRARKIEVDDSRPKPLTRGSDWLAFGFKQDVKIGQLIKLSNDLRDDKGYTREMVFAAVDQIEDIDEVIQKLESLL